MVAVRTDTIEPHRSVVDTSLEGDWSGPIQVVRTVHRDSVEISVCARPGGSEPGFAQQARDAYRHLLTCLRAHGAGPHDLVAEKVFLSDIGSQIPALREARSEFYAADGGGEPIEPATTFVQQPPARPGQLCEIQAFATLCRKSVKVQACALTSAPPGAIGKVVTCGALRHVYLNGVTGGDCGDGLDFFGQATSMFERAEQCLHHEGLSFIDVQRTWIYLGEMDANYDALNRARNEFFRSRGVNLSPASTGIQGVPFPPDRACALDLRAVVGEKGLRATPIHADTMNEASAYGSRFSRGLHLSLDDRHILYISGTASIDNTGQVVHAGNIEGQVGRMLLNIERLLTSQGATWENLVSATTYLKQPEYLGPFRDICRRRGIPEQVPNTICVADVCRPEWLCEMEAMAILA